MFCVKKGKKKLSLMDLENVWIYHTDDDSLKISLKIFRTK